MDTTTQRPQEHVRSGPEVIVVSGTKKIAGRLNELATGEYFCGISNEELMQLFF